MAFPIKLIFVLVLYARSFLHQEGFGEKKNVFNYSRNRKHGTKIDRIN